MNEDKKHINAKDKGLEMSDAIQKILDGIANKMTITKTSFLMQGIKGGLIDWAKAQKELYPRFQAETDKIIKQESKDLNKALSEIKNTLGFNASQMKTLKDGLNKGLKDTSRLSGMKYKEQINELKIQARVLKFDDSKFLNFISNKASNLRFTDNGVFIERKLDGKEIKRNIRWNNYLDMALRTEVQNYIADNMIASGGDLGVCFYTCVAYGDCAKDHLVAQTQGIFIDERWRDIVNDAYRDKVQEWVDAHPNYMTVQEAKGERGGFFTARPNCRHYFEPISITDVISISKEKNGLDKYRAKNDLSFKGAYNKDKADASRKLRNYERRIDLLKTDLESKKVILNSLSGASLNPQLKIEYYEAKEQVRIAQEKLTNAKNKQQSFLVNDEFIKKLNKKEEYEEIFKNNVLEKINNKARKILFENNTTLLSAFEEIEMFEANKQGKIIIEQMLKKKIEFNLEEEPKLSKKCIDNYLNKLDIDDKIKVNQESDINFYNSNCIIRREYNEYEKQLREYLDSISVNNISELIIKAKFAFDCRNALRQKMREWMIDEIAINHLGLNDNSEGKHRTMTFLEFINEKMYGKEGQKYSLEETLEKIINSSTKPNQKYNLWFGAYLEKGGD